MSESEVVSIEADAEAVKGAVRQSRLDERAIEQLQERITAAAAAQPGKPVILDMSSVEYLPSLGLGALVAIMRRFRQESHRFILVGLQGEVRTQFSITRLDKLFEIRSTMRDALEHLRTGA